MQKVQLKRTGLMTSDLAANSMNSCTKFHWNKK